MPRGASASLAGKRLGQLAQINVLELATFLNEVRDTGGGCYGYHWWVEADHQRYYAWGFGGQFVLVFPQLDLVAVTLSDSRTHYTKNKDPKALIQRWIATALT